jgi:hypothetical protein
LLEYDSAIRIQHLERKRIVWISWMPNDFQGVIAKIGARRRSPLCDVFGQGLDLRLVPAAKQYGCDECHGTEIRETARRVNSRMKAPI